METLERMANSDTPIFVSQPKHKSMRRQLEELRLMQVLDDYTAQLEMQGQKFEDGDIAYSLSINGWMMFHDKIQITDKIQ